MSDVHLEIFENHGQFNAGYVEELAEQSPDIIVNELPYVIDKFDYAANPVESEEWIESLMSRVQDDLYVYDDETDEEFQENTAVAVYHLFKASNFQSATCIQYLKSLNKFKTLKDLAAADNKESAVFFHVNMGYLLPALKQLDISDQLLVDITPAITAYLIDTIDNYSKYTHEVFTGAAYALERMVSISEAGTCTDLHKLCSLNRLLEYGATFHRPVLNILENLLGDQTKNVLDLSQLLQLQNNESYWKEALDKTVQPTIDTPTF